jgi:hypothetical protein
MIKTEIYSEGLVRTYSDAGMKIRSDETGAIYDEAIDPASTGRTYTETDEPIEQDETAEGILNIILGGAE